MRRHTTAPALERFALSSIRRRFAFSISILRLDKRHLSGTTFLSMFLSSLLWTFEGAYILNTPLQSLKILKSSDLMPYVVFVAPPSLQQVHSREIILLEIFWLFPNSVNENILLPSWSVGRWTTWSRWTTTSWRTSSRELERWRTTTGTTSTWSSYTGACHIVTIVTSCLRSACKSALCKLACWWWRR